jgi:glycosyltransferase involved in cell wall biosynthesis
MIKLLFCTHGFPGTGGGGNFNFIRYLPQYGIEPVVLTDQHPIDGTEKEVIENHLPRNLKIYSFWGFPKSPFRVFSKFLRAPRFAAYCDKVFFFPDLQVTMAPHAVLSLSSLIKKEKIDCVLTSSPPESYHLIGLLAKSRTRCPWIAHFRDLWTTKIIVNRPASFVHGYLARALERKIYRTADHIIANTEGNRDIYQQQFSVPTEKISYVPNGFDANEVASPSNNSLPPGPLKIGYMGYFDKPGFPWLEFLSTLKAVVQKHGKTAVELHVAGHISPTARRQIDQLGLDESLKMYGVLTHDAALKRMSSMDALLVLHYETGYSRAIVPHKLYHYLGLRKPILGIGEPDGEMGRIIARTHTGSVVSLQNQPAIFATVEHLLVARRNGQIPYAGIDEEIEKFEIQHLTQRLAATVKKTIDHPADKSQPLDLVR